jgi:anti-sigma regulatory factor (Ser/Thr protein kinase)
MDATAATRNVDYSVYLDAHDGATPCARDVLVGKLTEWQMPELIEDGSIIVAELVTNAAKLGEVFKMTLRNPGNGTLRIEVEDHSRDAPVRKDPLADLDNDDCDANGGRGLVLVEGLSDEWGYGLLPQGKVVWAVLSK